MGLEKVVELLKTQESEDIKQFSDIISTLKNDDKVISLYDFELHFLPYILGETEKTEVNTAVYISNILKITKSHHIGITVKNKDGETLYKIPPLIADTDITKLDNIAFGTIVNKVNSYLESAPYKVNGILTKVVNKVTEELDLADNSKMYMGELIKILTVYNDRVNKVLAKKGKTTLIKKEEEIEDDLFDY